MGQIGWHRLGLLRDPCIILFRNSGRVLIGNVALGILARRAKQGVNGSGEDQH